MDYKISLKERSEKGKAILLKQPKPTLEVILRQVKDVKEKSMAKTRR